MFKYKFDKHKGKELERKTAIIDNKLTDVIEDINLVKDDIQNLLERLKLLEKKDNEDDDNSLGKGLDWKKGKKGIPIGIDKIKGSGLSPII